MDEFWKCNITSEVVSDTVSVSVNFEFIGLSLSSTGDLTCTNNTTSLEAFTELFYFLDVDLLWETFDGNIISDPTQETIEVDQPGTYTVVVTNPESGCTGTETQVVACLSRVIYSNLLLKFLEQMC